MSTRKPRLRIVTGKGGVGKTAVATALALAEAQQQRRVLLAELFGRDSVATLLSAGPVGFQMREVLENIHVVDINPRDAMREYALMSLRFEAVYNAVFENRLVRRFLRLVPSLSELVMLGKLWFHEQETGAGQPRFDVLVVDAPATGHAKALLRAPTVVGETVPPGPLRENARLIQELLTDAARTQLHIVTTGEEMPVNEATELWRVAKQLGLRVGTSFLNGRLDALPPGALDRLASRAGDELLGQVVHRLRMREAARLEGERQLQRLPEAMLADAVSLPRIVAPHFDTDSVQQLAAAMAKVVSR